MNLVTFGNFSAHRYHNNDVSDDMKFSREYFLSLSLFFFFFAVVGVGCLAEELDSVHLARYETKSLMEACRLIYSTGFGVQILVFKS